MNDLDLARRLLAGRGLSTALEAHCRRVADCAAGLADRWDADPEGARVAGLLHDYCRELPRQEVLELARKHGVTAGGLERLATVQLLHGPLAAVVLRPFGFDPEVLSAIATHTVAGPGMTPLEKAVYLADAIEPGRSFAGVERLRALARTSPDGALAESVRRSVEELRSRGKPVHPETLALLEELDG